MTEASTGARFGIDQEYVDVKGESHPTPQETTTALLAAMGVDAEGAPQMQTDAHAYADVIVLRGAQAWSPEVSGELRLEDGSSRPVDARRELRVPLGYHELTPASGKPIRVIACPSQCYLPENMKIWGWATQLYAARSRQSWGIGDLADLATLGSWARRVGADALMINPLSAVTPVLPLEPSPYYPSSRRYRNPIYIRVEDVPRANELGDDLTRLAVSGRGLNEQRRIDRDAVFALKMSALEKCFLRFGGGRGLSEAVPDFERYRTERGVALEQFATYCAIAEIHGKDWHSWPEPLRRPDRTEVRAFRGEHQERVTFHAWLQWLLEAQLGAAAESIGIIQDLPIGLDVAGADAWSWQDLLADGVSVGAPPDQFNPAGQDWGLVPFVPHKLRGAGYQPFIETIRALARHTTGLRIDHVMGLFRLYWIPRGAGPKGGAFVRTRAEELLAILALESERARAFVVGEDLGTVEPGVRETMGEHRVLSYRLAYFEPGAPATFPELALSSITTHDLPTIAGLWTGRDLERSRAAGVEQDEAAQRSLRDKVCALAGLDRGAKATDDPAEQRRELSGIIERAHRALAQAPSRVLLATLDDALALEERPNIPGAPRDSPNWSLALPCPIDDLDERELPVNVAKALQRPAS
jgi:4-alpha-glucanotransferase